MKFRFLFSVIICLIRSWGPSACNAVVVWDRINHREILRICATFIEKLCATFDLKNKNISLCFKRPTNFVHICYRDSKDKKYTRYDNVMLLRNKIEGLIYKSFQKQKECVLFMFLFVVSYWVGNCLSAIIILNLWPQLNVTTISRDPYVKLICICFHYSFSLFSLAVCLHLF